MREYVVIYEKGPVSWGAYLPDLPGLVATGDSLEEVKALIKEGLDLHLEAMIEDGDAIPEPVSQAGVLQTSVDDAWSKRLLKSA